MLRRTLAILKSADTETDVTEIKTLKGEELELANTNDDLWVKFAQAPVEYDYAMARTIGIKGEINETLNCPCL